MTLNPPLGSPPCGGCTRCCQQDAVFLIPEEGDDPSAYETEPGTSTFNPRPVLMLKHKPDGSCIYLGEKGCTIYERRPVMCRSFDCRGVFRKFGGLSARERQALIDRGYITKEVLMRGQELLRQTEKAA